MIMMKGFSLYILAVFMIFAATFAGYGQQSEEIQQEYIIRNHDGGKTKEILIDRKDSVTVIKAYQDGDLVEERIIYGNTKEYQTETYSTDDPDRFYEDIQAEIKMAFPENTDSLFRLNIMKIDSFLQIHSAEIQHEFNRMFSEMEFSGQQVLMAPQQENNTLDEEILETDTLINTMPSENARVTKSFSFGEVEQEKMIELPLREFEISPNPNNGLFAISYTTGKLEEVEFRVLDEKGEMIYQTLVAGEAEMIINFNLQEMEKGSYDFEVHCVDMQYVIKLMIE